MKYFVYLRRSILFVAISILLGTVFLLSYYHPNTPNAANMMTASPSLNTTDGSLKDFMNELKEPVSPLHLKPEEFKKTEIFE